MQLEASHSSIAIVRPWFKGHRGRLWPSSVQPLALLFCIAMMPFHEVHAQQRKVNMTTLSYGIFSAESDTSSTSDPQQQRRPSTPQLLEQTQSIPLVLGTQFGFCYQIDGLIGVKKLTLTTVLNHPFTQSDTGSVANATAWTVDVPVTDGRLENCALKRLDKPYLLEQGLWRFSVKVGDQELLNAEFSAVHTDPVLAAAASVPTVNKSAAIINVRDCAPKDYPARAARHGRQGKTRLLITIDDKDSVVKAVVARSSGSTDLDQAAIDRLSSCQFKSGIFRGKPSGATFEIDFDWRLE